jgi:UDPglucose 6-dehydrogenase
LLNEVVRLNGSAVDGVVDHLDRALGSLDGEKIAVFGLAFKPQTDDVRNSPSLELVARLQAAGADVHGHDPRAGANAAEAMPSIVIHEDATATATGAAAVVVATPWREYVSLEWRQVARVMSGTILIDARHALDPSVIADAGLDYHAVGRRVTPRTVADASGG